MANFLFNVFSQVMHFMIIKIFVPSTIGEFLESIEIAEKNYVVPLLFSLFTKVF
jgi:hypothetical protein